jgi:hypothetical protein
MSKRPFRTLIVGLAVTLPLAAVAIPSSASAATTVTALALGSKGWRYKQVAIGAGGVAFTKPGFKDRKWAVGREGFGTAVGRCPWNNTAHVKTPWAGNTDILIRHHVKLPKKAKSVRIMGTVDNDAYVYLNGHRLGHVLNGYCMVGGINLLVPARYLKADNVVAVRGHDYGAPTYLNVEVTYRR